MLRGKNVVVAVTGGIAAYKTCTVVSRLVGMGASVKVVMTKNATEFVTPLTFETLSRNRCITDTFDRDFTWEVEHVSVAASADLFVVVPATANVIAKMAMGIADDFVTTTALAVTCPILVCPAMNTRMLAADATQKNLATLASRGVHILYGDSGMLACGDVGKGRVAEPDVVVSEAQRLLLPPQDMSGVRVLVTSGATSEDIDGVRCITNYSSGKMGTAIARSLASRGAIVTMIRGKSTVPAPTQKGISVINVTSTDDMFSAVAAMSGAQHAFVMAAAPADYKVARHADTKIKGDAVTLELVKNPDIAASVGRVKRADQTLVIFCAETGDPVESAKKKLIKKNADLVVANDVTAEGAGFDVDTNIVTLVTEEGVEPLPKAKKTEIADLITERVASLCAKKLKK